MKVAAVIIWLVRAQEEFLPCRKWLCFFCPLWNQLPQKDPGQEPWEGAAFQQQQLRDETLQPVGLAALCPTLPRKGSRAPNHTLAHCVSGEKGFV